MNCRHSDAGKVRRRRHDAATTRKKILTAARKFFAEGGYDEISLRQIAGAVGIDAAMIIRHFGSKDRLFAEAMRRPDLMTSMLNELSRARFGEQVVRYTLSLEETSREYHMLVAMLRSASHKPAARTLSEVADSFTTILAQWLGGKHADLRASLICSQLIGLLVMRHMLIDPALAAGNDLEMIVERIAPNIQSLVDS